MVDQELSLMVSQIHWWICRLTFTPHHPINRRMVQYDVRAPSTREMVKMAFGQNGTFVHQLDDLVTLTGRFAEKHGYVQYGSLPFNMGQCLAG